MCDPALWSGKNEKPKLCLWGQKQAMDDQETDQRFSQQVLTIVRLRLTDNQNSASYLYYTKIYPI